MRKKPPEAVDVFVGCRVRVARLMANMSQEKLGDALKLTFQQVQKYEKGTNRISSSRIQQISEILGKPVSWFFDEQPHGKAKAEGTDIVTKMLATPCGVKLAESYLAIKRNEDRHVVAEVAERLAQVG